MTRRVNRRLRPWVCAALLWLVPFFGHAGVSESDKARKIAMNWLAVILERDGSWGGATHPSIDVVREFKRGEFHLGYLVSVKPHGYIVTSAVEELAPIKAYSSTSTLDPADEEGMCLLLKDVMERRLKLMTAKFGGLDSMKLQALRGRTIEANRAAWALLLTGGSAMRSQLQALSSTTAGGAVGPLLRTSWNQGAPYSNFTPAGSQCTHTAVGCVATGLAQIMRYYCWPPHGEGSHSYSWDGDNSCSGGSTGGRDLSASFDDAYDWVNMPLSGALTTAQQDAVAELCYEAGVAVEMDYGCCASSAYLYSPIHDDAQKALEDYFYYNTPGNMPALEDRGDYSYAEWWNLIVNEIDHKRPILYNIVGSSGNFNHVIVVDGYDNSAGAYQVHANYGWDDGHTTWYTLDLFDCDNASGWQGGCNADDERLLRYIYPRQGLSGTTSGTLQRWYYAYVYGNVSATNLTVEAGALVQFLGGAEGTAMTCGGGTIYVSSSASDTTRFFSDGDPSRGMKLAGGKTKIQPNGGIILH